MTTAFVLAQGQISNWIEIHGPRLAVIIVGTLIGFILISYLKKLLDAYMIKGKEDTETLKLSTTVSLTVYWILAIAILVVAVPLILHEFGVDVRPVLLPVANWILERGGKIALTLALTFVAMKAAHYLTNKMTVLVVKGRKDSEAEKRGHTLGAVTRWVLQTSILLVAAMMLLAQIGVEVGPVIAAAGVVGLAVGFGAQNLVQDVISGFFILLEDQVRVGDVAALDGNSGYVERVTLRTIVLRDFDGSVLFVRNGKINVIKNMTKEFSFYVFNIGVSYREDVDEVMDIVRKLGAELQQDPEFKDDILAPIEMVGLDQFADSAVIIKARFKTKPIKQWRVGREFNRRLKKKFDEVGIEMPFPHITVYPGKDKKGDSPTLKLEIQGTRQTVRDRAHGLGSK